MKWKGKLINHIIEQLHGDSKWENTIEKVFVDHTLGIHLAIFNEPFLSLILNGEKKIESRFSINNIGPYQKVKKGDVVILKESGGLVIGVFVAGEVKFIHSMSKLSLDEIENKYGDLICSSRDKNFWLNRSKAKYCSLIEVNMVNKITPFKCEKKDRTGWVVLREGYSNILFNNQNET